MSVAILPMSKAHGWSDSVKGAVSRCAVLPIQRPCMHADTRLPATLTPSIGALRVSG